MNVLIVFASRYSQTQKIAQRMGDIFRNRKWLVDVRRVEDAADLDSLAKYGLVLIGSPIYAHRHDSQIAKFISKHIEGLNSVTTAFFSVCLATAGSEKSKLDAAELASEYLESLAFKPDFVTQFAGSLLYREYNWLLRLMMRWIAYREGGDTDTSKNHEYTDWEKVDSFARRLIEFVSNARVPGEPVISEPAKADSSF